MNLRKLIYVFLPALVISFQVFAGTIHVGPDYRYTLINAAVKAARAGDSIIIHGGEYKEETLVIDKPMVILGQGLPVMDGRKKIEIISIHSDHVTVSGLKLIRSGVSDLEDIAAIKVYKRHYVTIENNVLENNFFGIYLANSDSCTISGNSIIAADQDQHTSGNGIHLWQCRSIAIKNNHIKGHRDGIYFEFVKESTITGNKSEGNLRYGLHFMFSNNDTYTDNTFLNNGAGVAVMFSSGVKMFHNLFERNWGAAAYGILLKEIRDSEITDNIFRKNSTAITMEGATRINIHDNNFLGNGWAMKVSGDCDQCIITRNNLIGNSFDVSTTGSSTGNNFNGNYWDKYAGYDLNKDGAGDIPFFPVSLSALIMERIPTSLLFLHSFTLDLIDQSEKLAPQLIPQNICDRLPVLKKF